MYHSGMSKFNEGYYHAIEFFWDLHSRLEQYGTSFDTYIKNSDLGYYLGFLEGAMQESPFLTAILLSVFMLALGWVFSSWQLKRIARENSRHVK